MCYKLSQSFNIGHLAVHKKDSNICFCFDGKDWFNVNRRSETLLCTSTIQASSIIFLNHFVWQDKNDPAESLVIYWPVFDQFLLVMVWRPALVYDNLEFIDRGRVTTLLTWGLLIPKKNQTSNTLPPAISPVFLLFSYNFFFFSKINVCSASLSSGIHKTRGAFHLRKQYSEAYKPIWQLKLISQSKWVIEILASISKFYYPSYTRILFCLSLMFSEVAAHILNLSNGLTGPLFRLVITLNGLLSTLC